MFVSLNPSTLAVCGERRKLQIFQKDCKMKEHCKAKSVRKRFGVCFQKSQSNTWSENYANNAISTGILIV